MTGDEIRETFLTFFESKGHQRITSSSLIPVGDPTLLLTNAGMVQFKPYFSGESPPPNPKLTSVQKSFRTVDIDEVGDSTHLTMFEMLGNFSIGDYFKEGAIDLALECVTKAYQIPQDRFAATIHDSDDEAYALWLKAGIPTDRIFRFGDQDNWWGPPIHGEEGPCGPCSELHYDFGSDRGCGKPNCGPNCTEVVNATGEVCDRYIEVWNLVFMQFYHNPDGSRDPLPSTSIDTGMGLERMAMVKQNTNTFYETDLFKSLINKVEDISGKAYDDSPDYKYAMRVVSEHARSTTFLIADGVVPSNEGRGYVLRRVIRRAIRHGRRLDLKGSFLGELSETVIESMGDVYPELRNHRDFVLTVLRLEEERFDQAYQNGVAVLSDALKKSNSLEGTLVFQLWDTYGFPVEMTQEIAGEQNVVVDMKAFEQEMTSQRERARSSAQFTGDRAKIRLYENMGVGATEFLGYEKIESSSVVVGLIVRNQVVSEACKGEEVEIALVKTPFYPEGGGQVGDAGQFIGPDSVVEIHDTQMAMPGLIIHFGNVTEGPLVLGDNIDACVDPVRRQDTARNHTATHMLHAALRQVLGPHVRQAGSLVAPDRLRFDFSHVASLTENEMEQVEWLVNEKIRQNASVHQDEDSYVSAIERGALAFFGDKYDERVRLIEISNGASFSFEVCGGTHVAHTGELGSVFILGESSIGSGMRRIEAVSGRGAERVVRSHIDTTTAVSAMLQTPVPEIEGRIQGLLEEIDNLRLQKEVLERRGSLQAAEALLESKQNVDGVLMLTSKVSVPSVDNLREMSDWLKDKLGNGIIVLGTVIDDQPSISVSVTSQLVESGLDARDLARSMGKAMGGGGGGRSEMAQAGGRHADKLDEALALAPDLVRKKRETE